MEKKKGEKNGNDRLTNVKIDQLHSRRSSCAERSCDSEMVVMWWVEKMKGGVWYNGNSQTL